MAIARVISPALFRLRIFPICRVVVGLNAFAFLDVKSSNEAGLDLAVLGSGRDLATCVECVDRDMDCGRNLCRWCSL